MSSLYYSTGPATSSRLYKTLPVFHILPSSQPGSLSQPHQRLPSSPADIFLYDEFESHFLLRNHAIEKHWPRNETSRDRVALNENGFDTSTTSPAFEFAYTNLKIGSAATTFALSRSAATSSSKTTKIFIKLIPILKTTLQLLQRLERVLHLAMWWNLLQKGHGNCQHLYLLIATRILLAQASVS